MKIKLPPHIRVRTPYLNKLRPFIGKNIIKVLTGQRRVGKSYLLFQIIQLIQQENQNASILYINKEDLAFSFIKSAENLNEYILTHQSKSGKVIENSQRDINIAFVNELSKIFNLLKIDTQEVLAAAGTKWNFLSFKPGLVGGGHCISVDPFYLVQ